MWGGQLQLSPWAPPRDLQEAGTARGLARADNPLPTLPPRGHGGVYQGLRIRFS